MDYSTYLALDELLALQKAQSKPEQPDELLFIVVHQASELWFKVLLREMENLFAQLAAGDVTLAIFATKRINAIVRIVADQLSALDTLPPQRFAQLRGYLGTSSGSQSAQFRAIEAASGLRDETFLRAIAEHGETPDALYTGPKATPLFLLAEELLEYEQGFARWRFLHVQLVERIIGPGTSGTGGTLGAKYLSKTVTQRFFPVLWDVRARVFSSSGSTP